MVKGKTKEPEPGAPGAYTLKGIDPDLWRHVKAAAAFEGVTIGEWILKAIGVASGFAKPTGDGILRYYEKLLKDMKGGSR